MRTYNARHIHKSFCVITFTLLAPLFYCTQSFATTTCGIYSTYVPFTDTVNLGGLTTTIGPDTPDGSEIFSMKYSATSKSAITCNSNSVTPETVNFPVTSQYTTRPRGLTVGNQGAYAGQVYDTGLPGVGVVLRDVTDGNIGSILRNASRTQSTTMGTANELWGFGFTLKFIKTGPITPGVLSGANLPTVSVVAGASTPAAIGLPITTQTLKFAGQINIVSKSCTTPDVNVNLGSYPVSSFSGIGSVTPWVDSSIRLINCPAFLGVYTTDTFGRSRQTISGSGTLVAGTTTSNSLKITLTPASPVINSAQGIFAISNLGTTGVASGVGIQVAYGDIATPASMALANFGTIKSVNVKTTTPTDMTIPLGARYIQTDATAMAGEANGKMTFLINYQ